MSMRGAGGGMTGAGGGMKALRTLRRDDSVTAQPLSKGLARRIFRFAKPYRRKLLTFLILIIIDAAIGGANPLIYRAIIDDGIIPKHTAIVIELAVLLAVLAVLDAVLRWSPLRGDTFAMRDRVRNLLLAPWREAGGDGARLRLAAARALMAAGDWRRGVA